MIRYVFFGCASLMIGSRHSASSGMMMIAVELTSLHRSQLTGLCHRLLVTREG